MHPPEGPRDPIAGPDAGPEPPFPIRLEGEVIKGFGRGSKELGIPTANLPISGLELGGHSDLASGVYYGWASLSASTPTATPGPSHSLPGAATAGSSAALGPPGVHPMVMSIGWNPFYKNTKRSVEVHVLRRFGADFYGAWIKVSIAGFIRPEYDYDGLDALIADIRTDVEVAERSLAREGYRVEEARGEGRWLLDFEGRA